MDTREEERDSAWLAAILSATGVRLVNYFIPGPDRDSTPDPKYVMAILIGDKVRTIFEHRGYSLDRPLNGWEVRSDRDLSDPNRRSRRTRWESVLLWCGVR